MSHLKWELFFLGVVFPHWNDRLYILHIVLQFWPVQIENWHENKQETRSSTHPVARPRRVFGEKQKQQYKMNVWESCEKSEQKKAVKTMLAQTKKMLLVLLRKMFK